MGTFRQISTALLPLKYVEKCFLCTILVSFRQILFKLCILVDIEEERLAIIEG